MTQQECLNYIDEVKEKVEVLLRRTEQERLLELWKYLNKERVKFVIQLDGQLIHLEAVCRISIEEKRDGMNSMMLDRCRTLQELEELYREIKWCCFRIENQMPEEVIEEEMKIIVENEISGIAIQSILKNETLKYTHNLLYMARGLKKRGRITTAAQMLLYAEKQGKLGNELLLELADCWLEGMQFERALETLKKIQKPSFEISELICELEKNCGNETI